jgi:hypothetical protein
MKKYIVIGLIFVLGIIAILAIPTKLTEQPTVTPPVKVTLPIPPVIISPSENTTITVAPKKEFINSATEYYLGNWGKTDKSRLENFAK